MECPHRPETYSRGVKCSTSENRSSEFELWFFQLASSVSSGLNEIIHELHIKQSGMQE